MLNLKQRRKKGVFNMLERFYLINILIITAVFVYLVKRLDEEEF